MENKGIIIGGVVLALVLSLIAVFKTPGVGPQGPAGSDGQDGRNFAAQAGPEYSEHQYFNGGLTWGQNCFSTSTTGTLSAGRLNSSSCLTLTATGAGQAAVTWTLPASTTMGALIPRAGNCQTWFIDASDVAAATTTTITAGTGHDVVGLDATGAGTGADVIDGAEFGTFTSCRQADGDVVTFVQEYIHAD